MSQEPALPTTHPDDDQPDRPAVPFYRRPRFALVVACAIAALLLIFTPSRRMLHAMARRISWAILLPKPDLPEAERRLRGLLAEGEDLPLPDARVLICKSDRRLELYNGERLVKSYPIALGGEPTGPKTRKGDLRTPEGEYFICTRRTKTPYHLFLGISYPNARDARLAKRDDRIDLPTATSIVDAESARRRPAWNTSLGGAIGIHGRGSGRGDWTLGCIALNDLDVEEVWVATTMGTPVEIRGAPR